MAPLFFMERLLLESMVRHPKNKADLSADTAIEGAVLDHLLLRLMGRGFITQNENGIFSINQAAKDQLIELFSGIRQKQNEVQDILLQLGQRHLKADLAQTSWHLKKVFLTKEQVTYLNKLLQIIKELLDSATLSESPHALQEEYIFTWAYAQCGDLVKEAMLPLPPEAATVATIPSVLAIPCN